MIVVMVTTKPPAIQLDPEFLEACRRMNKGIAEGLQRLAEDPQIKALNRAMRGITVPTLPKPVIRMNERTVLMPLTPAEAEMIRQHRRAQP